MSWTAHPLFAGLTPEQVAALVAVGRERELPPGAALVEEGQPAGELLVVLEGEVEIATGDGRVEVVLGRRGPGTVIGEVALVDDGVRSATVRALTPVRVRVWPYSRLQVTAPSEPGEAVLEAAKLRLLANLARVLAARLRQRTTAAVDVARDRLAAARLTVSLLLGLCFYIVVLSGAARLDLSPWGGTTMVSLVVLTVFALATVHFIRAGGYAVAEFGLTTRGLRRSVAEGAGLAMVAMVMLTLAKWLWISLDPALAHVPLFEARQIVARTSSGAYLAEVASYTAFTFVQELVARGGIQTALERFLPGPRPERRALLLATVLFSATHFHVAPGFALATLVPGLFWGWLYQRHRTLAGVTLNHALVGLYAIFVLGRSVLG